MMSVLIQKCGEWKIQFVMEKDGEVKEEQDVGEGGGGSYVGISIWVEKVVVVVPKEEEEVKAVHRHLIKDMQGIMESSRCQSVSTQVSFRKSIINHLSSPSSLPSSLHL